MKTSSDQFFIYARKSTDEATRQVLSIEAQLFELRKQAEREGVTVGKEFVECRTAKQPGRPVFNQMLAEIEKGKASGILAWHPDRLARNMVDGGRIIHLVDLGKIKDLKFPNFAFEPNAHGKFMLSIHFSQGKYYVDNLSENIKRGIATKLRNGIFPTWAPTGYLNDKARRCIVIDPAKAPLVRKMFELYAEGGYSVAEVKKRMDNAGLMGRRNKRLSINNYHVMLTNPVYFGLIRYKGVLYEGKHDPIISKATFDRVQEALKAKSKAKTPSLKPFLYRGLFHCGECGCFVTTETQKGHNYLRCTKRKTACSQRYVREEAVSIQMDGELRKFVLPLDWPDLMLAELQNERVAWGEAKQAQATTLGVELAQSEKRLDTLLDLVLSEAIGQDEYASKKQALLNQKTKIKEKLATLEADTANRFEPVEEFLKALKQGAFLASQGSEEEKRDFLKNIGSNFTVVNQTLSVEFKNHWNCAAKFTSPLLAQNPFWCESSSKSNWRRERDSNPRKDCSFTGLANLRFRPLSHLSSPHYSNRPGPRTQAHFHAGRSPAGFPLGFNGRICQLHADDNPSAQTGSAVRKRR
jgi:site-specific DNA recombinase